MKSENFVAQLNEQLAFARMQVATQCNNPQRRAEAKREVDRLQALLEEYEEESKRSV